MTTVSELLSKGVAELSGISITARLDVEVLLKHVLSLNNLELVLRRTDSVPEEKGEAFLALIDRRKKLEPIAYLVGKKEFFCREFKVTPATLIPRPETEHLIEDVLKNIGSLKKESISILDLGTGSGSILITLVLELRKLGANVTGVGVDLSHEALAVAAHNSKALGTDNFVQFRLGSWWQPIRAEERFSVVITNPPYISNHDINISPEIRFEPPAALFSGTDGLDDYREILAGLSQFIESPGLFLGEFGSSQGGDILKLARSSMPTAHVEIRSDLAGLDRYLFCLT
jgi:release factor glutamine methyltransferase